MPPLSLPVDFAQFAPIGGLSHLLMEKPPLGWLTIAVSLLLLATVWIVRRRGAGWALTLGAILLFVLPVVGLLLLFVDSFRPDGRPGWFHYLPPFLWFLHPPFARPGFYLAACLLGIGGCFLGRRLDRLRQ